MTIQTREGHIGGVRAGTAGGSYVFPLSSEAPYRRYDGLEILSHDDAAIDLSWLNSGNAPLLDTHSRHELRNQIGVVSRAWLENKRVYVEVKFSNRPEGQAIKQDVDDGIIRNVSVGYEIHKVERDEDSEEYLVTRWTPKEASFVPVPADMTVGMGRSATVTKEGHMPATETENTPSQMPGVMTEDQRAEALETSINEISTLAEQHSRGDLARAFTESEIRNGRVPSLAAFRGIMRANLPEHTPLRNEDIGMSARETQRFSLTNVMRAIADNDWRNAGFEQEAISAAVEAAGRDSKHGGVIIPSEVMRNWGDFADADGVQYRGNEQAVRAAMATSGNANVLTTDHLAARFIDNLRNESAFLRAGATMLTGLDNDVEIPGGDQNIAAAWLASEDADVAESVPTFRKVSLTPHDLGAYTDVTRRMLQQSTIAMEAYIRMQMVDAVRIAIDLAAGYGSGASGVPEGLANTTGIGSVTFAAAIPTRGEIIDLRTAIAETNRGRGVTYISGSEMVGDLQQTKVDAGSGIFLMGDDATRLVGNSFIESNQVTSGDLFAGVFSDMLIGMWGGLELARSTEAKFLSGGLRFRVIQTVDVDFTRVGSFALGNDTA
jgi:HK97 family phage major capsid protein